MANRAELLLTRLAAGQAAICSCSDDAEADLVRLREWLRSVGYTPLGPAFLTWDQHMQRQLHQPIAHVFAPLHTDSISIIQRRDSLMLAVALAVRDARYNVAGLYDYAKQHGLEPFAAPYVPLSEAATDQVMVRGYLPVLPRGTDVLVPHPSRLSRKIGWIRQDPLFGEPISLEFIRAQYLRNVLRWSVAIFLATVLLLPFVGLAWQRHWFDTGLSNIFTVALVFGMMMAVAASIAWWRSTINARRRWNHFWQTTPTPPLLLIDFEVEFDG